MEGAIRKNSGVLAYRFLVCVSSRKLFYEELSYLVFQIYCLLAASKAELRLPPPSGPSTLVVLLFFIVVFRVPEFPHGVDEIYRQRKHAGSDEEGGISFFAVGLDANKFATFHIIVGAYIAHVVVNGRIFGRGVGTGWE